MSRRLSSSPRLQGWLPRSGSPKLIMPRQMRDTSRPVAPRRVYSMPPPSSASRRTATADRRRPVAGSAPVDVDVQAAVSFLTGSGRLLDRRRLDLLLGTGTPESVLAALDGYANADGGFGWGREPGLRGPESQPAGAMHALEALNEAAAVDSARVPALLDWLQGQTLPDGGLPFALPMRDPTATAPFWAGADPTISALQTTSQVAAQAHRLARHRPDVAASPWLHAATGYCLAAIDRMDTAPPAHELLFAVRFADAVHGAVPEADLLLDRLGRYLPAHGPVPGAGGSPGEALRPLNFSPDPDGASRALLEPGVIDADLARLAAEQQPDGGWRVDFTSYSPMAAVEWRGYATVDAVGILRRNGVV